MPSLTPNREAAERSIAGMVASLDRQFPNANDPNRATVRIVVATVSALVRALAEERDNNVPDAIVVAACQNALGNALITACCSAVGHAGALPLARIMLREIGNYTEELLSRPLRPDEFSTTRVERMGRA